MGRFQNSNGKQTSYKGYDSGIYAFTRWSEVQKLLIVVNFSWQTTSTHSIKIPSDIIQNGI
jgi:glycosidase